MSQNQKKMLLLTSTASDDGGIGAIFLNDLLTSGSGWSYFWYVERPFLAGVSLRNAGTFVYFVFALLSRSTIWQVFRLSVFRLIFMKWKVDKIKRALNDNDLESILLTTSSPELIVIGRALEKLGVNVYVMVLDDPEYLIKNLGIDGSRVASAIMKDFGELLQKSVSLAVISEPMKEKYSEAHRVESVVIRHGIDPMEEHSSIRSRSSLKIVFAGSLYSKTEWNALVKALKSSRWEISGQPVELIFVGAFPRSGALKPTEMTIVPQMPQSDVLNFLKDMDIGYLPYWFDTKYRLVAETSFPGKLTAYAAAGLDVFHHGPKYSSVTRFLAEFPFGASCNSLDPEVIVEKLEWLVARVDSSRFRMARQRAMEEALSLKAMGKAFDKFLCCG